MYSDVVFPLCCLKQWPFPAPSVPPLALASLTMQKTCLPTLLLLILHIFHPALCQRSAPKTRSSACFCQPLHWRVRTLKCLSFARARRSVSLGPHLGRGSKPRTSPHLASSFSRTLYHHHCYLTELLYTNFNSIIVSVTPSVASTLLVQYSNARRRGRLSQLHLPSSRASS